MSLIADYSGVQGYEALHSDLLEKGKSDYLCFALMGVGISSVTERNWIDVFSRIEIVQRLEGAFISDNGEPVYYTPEDIERRIGYTTNASEFPWTQFCKGIRSYVGHKALSTVKRRLAGKEVG